MADALTEFVADQYDDFQFVLELINKERKFLNYGYSRTGREPYETKQEQLCLTVFEAAEVKSDHLVVDVGFGSGEQDLLFANRFAFQKLIGYNIAPSQVEFATGRAREAGLSERLEFRRGQAESMPEIPDGSVDAVLAVECAFYFDRPRFYREAARILRPGGRLVLADITFSDRLKWITRRSEDLQRVSHLSFNRSSWEADFDTLRLETIRRQAVPGSQQTVFRLLGTILRRFRWSTRQAWRTLLNMALSTQITNIGFRTGLIRYDLIVLERKPSSATG